MSYDAWGDDDAGDYDHLLDAGWWPSEIADAVKDAIKALCAAPVYEGGDMARGISIQFLMRLTLLEEAAELRASDDPLVVEARKNLAPTKQEIMALHDTTIAILKRPSR